MAWDPLWQALRDHGVSDHMVWLIRQLYADQVGVIAGESTYSDEFPISAGVRQGCALSAKLFTSAMEWAMSRWKQRVRHLGIDLGDGGEHLTNLRFADDLLLFAYSEREVCFLLDTLVSELLKVGLALNAKKTKALTTTAQAPSTIQTPDGLTINVINRDSAHKWLGCMLSTGGADSRTLDLNYHMQCAAKAFYANRRILCDKRASVTQRLKLFNSVVTTVACFAAEHRSIYSRKI